ncbi:SusC/RagA family TonB-linked outer membrane protein [Muricauda sp. JGD-17]|uniref:SusC/RagA family TonB-linked outer membrane protein n=1 Tax=Flagellimonas ochracea TaxID=2696472 RepID=A0A964TAU2_9FLAO|nr:TonB-dependent receptor [Allomuricauda ochracea]NAY91425.1 SusC/RagA family TonB-linked outer membrane protein [Allomuricauda ochracea]
MQFSTHCQPKKSEWQQHYNLWRIMKLSAFFLVVCLQMAMASSAQTVSLTLREAPIQSVFEQINEQTGYEFLYNSQLLSEASPVTLDVKDISLIEALELCFSNQPFSFTIKNKTIIVQPTKGNAANTAVQSQDPITITGQVTNTDGVPLPGVSIVVKGTSRGVATDFDGNYTIVVPNGQSILVFTSVGYSEQEITVGNRTIINITMEESVSQLDEVVLNAGYYNTVKREVTGSIAKVSAVEIENSPPFNPLQSLQGRVAGVNIVQNTGVPGGGFNIQIRGINSLRSDGSNPLYIIDGVPFSSSPLSFGLGQGAFGQGGGNPLNTIDPSNIESIEILKDADATAIYGSRGANGVVLIKTKKGQLGKTSVNVKISSGFGKVANRIDVLNTQQYLEMRREAFANDGVEPTPRNAADLLLWDQNRYTDWQEVLVGGNATISNISTSVSGGNERTQFLIGANFYEETSVFPKDFPYKRASALFNLNHTSSDNKFSTTLSVNYSNEDNDLPNQDFMTAALKLAPNAPEGFDENGNLNFENFNANPFSNLLSTFDAQVNNLISNLNLSYSFTKNLRLKSSFGYTKTDRLERLIRPQSSIRPTSSAIASTRIGDQSVETWIIEPQIEYNKEFGNHSFKFLVGTTFQETINNGQTSESTGFPSDALLENIAAATTTDVFSVLSTKYRYNAVFGRVNYNYEDKYILNLTGRRDGSSRFGPGRQFGNFGAVGVAWLFTNENFFGDKSILNYGKLRGNYGITGNDQIGDYQFLETWVSDGSYLNDAGLVPSRLPNRNFGWESTRKLEGGLELGFFKNSLFLEINHYRNRSSNQLVGIPLPDITGFASVQDNRDAVVQNTGWEFDIRTSYVKSNSFRWESSINVTIPRNKLISYPDLENTGDATSFEVGESIFIQKLFHFNGVDPETGNIIIEDLDGDGRISLPNDLRTTEPITQDFFGGFNNSLKIKNVQLDFLFQFVKQKGFNLWRFWNDPPGRFNINVFRGNQPVEVLNRWQNPGDITDIQRYTQRFSSPFSRASSGDFGLADASFIRLKNVQLAYNFPEVVLDKLKLEQLRLFFQGQNLLTITNYFGLDPETQSNRSLPPLRTINMGLEITF